MPALLTTTWNLFQKNEQFSLIASGSLILLSIVVMGLISLLTLNDKATKGYRLNQLEAERQSLVVDSEETDMLIMRARSLTTIEENTSGMLPANEVVYVSPVAIVAER